MMKETINASAAPAAIGPYSHAVRVGELLFLSGQVPIVPSTGVIPEGIEAQTHQAIKNVEAILSAAGCSLANVVKTTVYLADMSLFGAMNEVYAQAFTEPFPARSAVAVRELPKGALVEIEVVAAI